MEPPHRTGPPPIVVAYLIPAALLGVVLAVLMDRGRFPTDDRLILIAVLAIAARIYLRDRLLIAAALAFAIAAWAWTRRASRNGSRRRTGESSPGRALPWPEMGRMPGRTSLPTVASEMICGFVGLSS